MAPWTVDWAREVRDSARGLGAPHPKVAGMPRLPARTPPRAGPSTVPALKAVITGKASTEAANASELTSVRHYRAHMHTGLRVTPSWILTLVHWEPSYELG